MAEHDKEYSLLPFAICQEWQLQVGYERSFKIQPGNVLANRYLIGIPTANLTPQRAHEIARRLGMPPQGQGQFWRLYPDANLLLIGFEAHDSGCIYKLYLEFDDHPIRWGDDPRSTARWLHHGIKWNVRANSTIRTSDYVWYPGLSLDGIRRYIQPMITGMSIENEIRTTIDIATAGAQDAELRYLEVDEAGRRSFDLNLYSTGRTVSSIYQQCKRIAAQFGVASDLMDRLEPLVATRTLGHVATGRSAMGTEFFTVYYDP